MTLSSSFRDEDLLDMEKTDTPVSRSPTIFSILQRDTASTGLSPSGHVKPSYSRGLRPERTTDLDSSSLAASSPSSSTHSSSSEDLQFKMESDSDTIKEDRIEFLRLD